MPVVAVQSTPGLDAVQKISIGGSPTSGTFKLSWGSGNTTGSITYSSVATTLASNIQAALVAVTAIGSGNVSVVSNNSSNFTVTFISGLANAPQAQLATQSTTLVPTGSVSTTYQQIGVVPTASNLVALVTAPPSGQWIRIIGYQLTSDIAQLLTLQGGATPVIGPMALAAGGSVETDPTLFTAIDLPPAQPLELFTSLTTGNVGGWIEYAIIGSGQPANGVGQGKPASITVSIPATATHGTPVTFTVTILDIYGNAATAYDGFLQFTSTDSLATLPANSQLPVGTGTGTFSITFSSTGTGTQTVTATSVLGPWLHATSGNCTVS